MEKLVVEKTFGKTNGGISDHPLVVRVMTYNIHSCVSAGGHPDPLRVAEIIEQLNVDVAALQEVDAVRPPSEIKNQAEFLSKRLDMEYVFFPVEKRGLHAFGLAVLTRFPFIASFYDWLPNLYPKLKPRKRGAVRATLQTPAGPVHLFNTHLSVYKLERWKQMRALLNRKWLLSIPENEPVIFCGDLNAGAASNTYRTLTKRFIDVQRAANPPERPKPTFHAKSPFFRIDHIFVSKHFKPLRAEVMRNQDTESASDHLPLIADLAISNFLKFSSASSF